MAKNALQAQLLKAGLVDSKKAKKISKQTQHAKRTGDLDSMETKKALAEAQAKKLEKDQRLNQQKQQALEEKALKANIVQMIKQHQITDTDGDVSYQFVDESKVKKISITQKTIRSNRRRSRGDCTVRRRLRAPAASTRRSHRYQNARVYGGVQ